MSKVKEHYTQIARKIAEHVDKKFFGVEHYGDMKTLLDLHEMVELEEEIFNILTDGVES